MQVGTQADSTVNGGIIRRAALGFARHWIAGERREDALERAAHLQRSGMRSIINYLGEDFADEHAVDETVAEYEALLRDISAGGLEAAISIKVTQLGLLLDRGQCEENVLRIVSAAASNGIFVWFDMEHHAVKDDTIALFRRVHSSFANAGICLQAYLKSTEAEAKALAAEGAIIRLCKGAYRPPLSMSVGGPREIRENFIRCAEMLARDGRGPFAVASHDDSLISAARSLDCSGCPPEFQFLLGVRERLGEELVREGKDVSIYVPYGTRWVNYAYRRIRERPANALLLARSLIRG